MFQIKFLDFHFSGIILPIYLLLFIGWFFVLIKTIYQALIGLTAFQCFDSLKFFLIILRLLSIFLNILKLITQRFSSFSFFNIFLSNFPYFFMIFGVIFPLKENVPDLFFLLIITFILIQLIGCFVNILIPFRMTSSPLFRLLTSTQTFMSAIYNFICLGFYIMAFLKFQEKEYLKIYLTETFSLNYSYFSLIVGIGFFLRNILRIINISGRRFRNEGEVRNQREVKNEKKFD
ncbi:hypothetical protein M0811_12404 [Anaeramoeba ignava]|uniref:Uncharacterized protein n=1 Tax=Anaeramoeba ignava TaxID=1746090 RepID=A0A9Q0R5Q4_ANAIG|nr:hypothetical protein M0811_12404 [Anaeramoeba ignava]